ncbi:MAG: DUF885 domain-containing protein [Xanthomonadales bacterium]|nr:DUF885 domain-containing protein [Xanthomonadales bacterium]
MKKFFKWLGLGLATVVLLTGVFVVHTIYFKPLSLNLFYNKVFIEFMFRNPEMLSSMRLLEPMGLHYKNDELSDSSPARALEDAAINRRNLEQLLSYDSSELKGEQQLSYAVLSWFLEDIVAGEPFMYHNYPVNQLFGVQSNLPTFMATQHLITSQREAEDYIARLNQFDEKFTGVIQGLELREEKGIIPPKFVVQKVLKEMQGFVAQSIEENILYSAFVEKVEKLDQLNADVRKSLLLRAASAIRLSVQPAYRQLIKYFQGLKPKATQNHGVWSLPDGDAFYELQVRANTTTDMTATQIHKIGRAEVLRIEAAMDQILCVQNLCEGSVGVRVQALSQDPRYLYQPGETTGDQILQDYQQLIEEITVKLPDWFGTLPQAPVKVERIPEFKQDTAPGAYYNPPTMDGSRPGIFYANLRDFSAITQWGMPTLAYHEAMPGHHLQIAIAMEIKGVPMFRNFLPFTAFSEGWALYSEQLAYEMGMLENPLHNLGRLQAEMFRAVRLVVDTGLHKKRWSRERAIRYMLEKTGMPKGEVVAEVERYMVMPGQALAYKVGMLKILELRERARQELGDKFDIRDFHDAVLTHGGLPLTLVEQEVDRYILEKQQ